MDAATPKLPISLPLKIFLADDGFAVEDARGRVISRTGFDEDASRRAQTRQLSKDEAREIAQMIARLLTDVGVDDDPFAGKTIPLEDLSAENDE